MPPTLQTVLFSCAIAIALAVVGVRKTGDGECGRNAVRNDRAAAQKPATRSTPNRQKVTASNKNKSEKKTKKDKTPVCKTCDSGVKSKIGWMTNYSKATELAEHQNKMLFVYFCDAKDKQTCGRFKAETLESPEVCKKLKDYVCVHLPLSAKITIGGKKTVLIEHESFQEMLGRPGIAIVDYRSPVGSRLHGMVVSMFPITEKLYYTPEQMAVILDLPPATLTQRTLIYAVRTHPERPASTESKAISDLLEEAENHSQYQADIRVQGHHFWDTRFARIVSRLPGGGTAREVCAESWPGENLVEAAIECVRCWRLSSGHWSAVRAENSCYGYDMKRGANGIWYATGIFGAR